MVGSLSFDVVNVPCLDFCFLIFDLEKLERLEILKFESVPKLSGGLAGEVLSQYKILAPPLACWKYTLLMLLQLVHGKHTLQRLLPPDFFWFN